MPFTNNTMPMASKLPPLPNYSLQPVPELIPGIPDVVLKILITPAIYWASGLVFHLFDAFNLFQNHKLHEPEETATRNRVTLSEVIRGVLIQQALQTGLAALAIYHKGITVDFTGKESYDITILAIYIRKLRKFVPILFSLAGVDTARFVKRFLSSWPLVAAILGGGDCPQLTESLSTDDLSQQNTSFAVWETVLAETIYWYIVPVAQFGLAIVVIDLWQYLIHRLMHTSKFLYSRVHSVHHRLYVPFAWGALYNHPFEGFLLDTLGAVLASEAAQLSVRQSILFFALTTVKTIDDHSGYSFPWDPLQFMTPNNVLYHDIHHQNWGIKTNFSQPFLIFWDHYLGTEFKGDTTTLYKKNVELAKAAVRQKKKDISQEQKRS